MAPPTAADAKAMIFPADVSGPASNSAQASAEMPTVNTAIQPDREQDAARHLRAPAAFRDVGRQVPLDAGRSEPGERPRHLGTERFAVLSHTCRWLTEVVPLAGLVASPIALTARPETALRTSALIQEVRIAQGEAE